MNTDNEDVRIVFTASRTWFGKLIRKITKSKVSHVFVEIPVWGQRFAVESTVSGTRIVPAHKARHYIHSEFQCSFPVRPGLLAIGEKLGSPYDWAGTFFLGILIIVGQWFKMKWKKLCWNTKSLKCSELVAFFLQSVGVIRKEANIEITTPDDLLLLCTSLENRFRKIT